MLLGNPEVPRGGIEGPMAQEHLDRPDIDARFEEVGRKTVAQRLDTLAVRDPRALLGMIVDLRGRADRHRHLGLAACKQPRGGPVAFPVGAQFGQQPGGEPGVAILPPFALFDAQQHAITFDIREPQPDDFTHTQARGICGHQEDTVPRIPRMRKQALEFLDAQDLGKL
jgi:hypothetical protein